MVSPEELACTRLSLLHPGLCTFLSSSSFSPSVLSSPETVDASYLHHHYLLRDVKRE